MPMGIPGALVQGTVLTWWFMVLIPQLWLYLLPTYKPFKCPNMAIIGL